MKAGANVNFDTGALHALAAANGADPAHAIGAVEDALTIAYRANDDADPDAYVTLTEEGDIVVAAADGTVLPTPGFSRVAVAIARQAVVAWVKDVERLRVVGPWGRREGGIVEARVTGTGRNGELRLTADGTQAVLPAGEQISSETLEPGQTVTALLLAANGDDRGNVKLTLSRRQPALIEQLITAAVPEVREGIVEIVNVVRDPGHRSKVAVRGADAVGAVVGAGGYRMRQVVAALAGERVDLVEHSDDLATYVARALTPARTEDANVLITGAGGARQVQVVVTRDQLEAAKGKDDMNLSLAKRLTGAKISFALAD
jgi:N utilization substance protein A